MRRVAIGPLAACALIVVPQTASALSCKRAATAVDRAVCQAWQRTKLLDALTLVQDDPRWDPVVASDFGVQHLSREQWAAPRAEIAPRARDWRRLLRFDLADWMEAELIEGSVFFLIRQEIWRSAASSEPLRCTSRLDRWQDELLRHLTTTKPSPNNRPT